MTITVLSQTKDHYVELTGSGKFSMSAAVDLLRHSLEFAIENDRAAALIDVTNVNGNPDQLERFELGIFIPEEQLRRDKEVALAIVGKQPLIDPNRFMEMVAVNRCAVLKVFEDMDEAIRWLEYTTA
ncbi:MAG: hypothetical protein OER97_04750 [Gammaproteobacteria bacterium]|nr:hypothetical protein [Gammaproteobacteria bacterium]